MMPLDDMMKMVWRIQVTTKDDSTCPTSYGGVCITKDGLLLTSSQACKFNDNGLLLGISSSEVTKKLELVLQDAKSGWGLLRVKDRKEGEFFEYASLRDGMVMCGENVVCIGDPSPSMCDPLSKAFMFCCLRGRTTHRCVFESEELGKGKSMEFRAGSEYLDVNDVFEGLKSEELKLSLSESRDRPVISVQGFFHEAGLTGSPIFDSAGVVIGLEWFGEKQFVYCISGQTILHDLFAKMPEVLENLSIKGGGGGGK